MRPFSLLSYPINLTGRIVLFLFIAHFFPSSLSDLPLPFPSKKLGTLSSISRRLGYLGADDHAGIGFRICSSTNISPCVSLRKHRTKWGRNCASRPRPKSSPASSCSSAESAQTIRVFEPRQPPVRLRRTGRRSGRRSSALMRCGRPIARYSVSWGGMGWKSRGSLF